MKVGSGPSTVAVDQATDTVYVTNVNDNTVSVINGATCNARVTSGCGQTPATVPVGGAPIGIFADDANHTVYVANFNDSTVSMIDSKTCNGGDLAGCPKQSPPKIAVAGNPGDFDVNQRTHTAYVTLVDGVTAFDTDTCNSTRLAGCAHTGRVTIVNRCTFSACGPFSGKVDANNNTVYVADGQDNTISVINGSKCDAADLADCAAQTPATVTVGPVEFFEVAIWVAVDARLHSVYVVNQKDDDLSVIDANACNGHHLAHCARLQPATIHTGEDPESVVLDERTQTLYTANQDSNNVSVIAAAHCNAAITSGCRHTPPPVAVTSPRAIAADTSVATVYVTSGSDTVSMIKSHTCNSRRLNGCASTPATVRVGVSPMGVAIDHRTHTVYTANFGAGSRGSVSVIDAKTCNAATTSGCRNLRTMRLPDGNGTAVAVNPSTDTIYLATSSGHGPDTVSVFNGATCNATDTSGCNQEPDSVRVGFGAGALAVDAATNTIYVANSATSNSVEDSLAGNTVSVIDGATCDAANTTGCAHAPRTVALGPIFTTPDGVAVDQAADTIYVSDLQNGEGPGIVSVIDGATCNATISTGCGQTPATVRAGFGPAGIAYDGAARRVVVANLEDTSISVIDAAACNAIVRRGCSRTPPKIAVGRVPSAVAIDPTTGTIYTSNNGDNTVSVVPITK